jgi:2-iminobutanoate/2-iminopropanoate deaminase
MTALPSGAEDEATRSVTSAEYSGWVLFFNESDSRNTSYLAGTWSQRVSTGCALWGAQRRQFNKERDTMERQSRRGLLKGAVKAAAAATAGVMVAAKVPAQATGKLEKRSPLPATPESAAVQTGAKPPFSSVVAYGNLLFLAGVGAHFQGTVQEHTAHVLDDLEKTLVSSGSSLQKVLKVSVFLADIKDFDAMNSVYVQRNWGPIMPARTTVSPSGIPGNSLVEIDMIAYI